MSIPFINCENIQDRLTWDMAVKALDEAHQGVRSTPSDIFIPQGPNTFMSRAAWVDGIGFGVKSLTFYPDNPVEGRPSVQGIFSLFDKENGAIKAQIDCGLITYWKTAADSLLGAKKLARPEAKELLIIGAGVVAGSLIAGYAEMFPKLETISIYARNPDRAQALIDDVTPKRRLRLQVVTKLDEACQKADIIAAATSSLVPVISGQHVTQGTHIDLIGAFTADMREADDALMSKGRIFVDCFDTTISHIGEIMIPIETGFINRSDILGDHYDLCQGRVGRQTDTDVTVFKNGGGAHLDVMIADLICKIAHKPC